MPSAAPRLLAVDLDGTLLSRAGHPHELDVQALRAARDAGVAVTIITGRLFSGTKAAAEALGIDGPLGCADGSHIVHSSGATIRHSTIRGADARLLRDRLASNDVTAFIFDQDTIVHDEEGEGFLDYVRTWSPQVHRAARVLDHSSWLHERGVTAVVAVADEARIGAAAHSIRSELAHAAQVISFPLRNGLWCLLTRSSGIDKGTALEFIAHHAGVAREETVAVGDWINDVPMFRAAGRSFAMGQAPAEVKALATDQLSETPETGGGIARVVRDVFGVRF